MLALHVISDDFGIPGMTRYFLTAEQGMAGGLPFLGITAKGGASGVPFVSVTPGVRSQFFYVSISKSRCRYVHVPVDGTKVRRFSHSRNSCPGCRGSLVRWLLETAPFGYTDEVTRLYGYKVTRL